MCGWLYLKVNKERLYKHNTVVRVALLSGPLRSRHITRGPWESERADSED